MPTFQRGSVLFERGRPIRGEFFLENAIYDYDCLPRITGGRRKEYVAPTAASVLVPEDFLQPEEVDRLVQAANETPDVPLDISTLVIELLNAFDFQPFSYDYDKLPARWDQREPCFNTMVSVQTAWEVYEITARATTDLTFGPLTFPAGDVLAVFRVRNPINYQFKRTFRFDPECCPDQAPIRRDAETAGLTSFILSPRFRIEGVKFTAGQLREFPDVTFSAPANGDPNELRLRAPSPCGRPSSVSD
ncbi:MAG: hypothetical protein ACREU8_07920 [Gammaproteobacteria bacterium]